MGTPSDRCRPEVRAEKLHGTQRLAWKRRRSPQGSTSSSAGPRAPSQKERFAGFPTARKFCFPLPAVVTPRFLARPPGSAQARWTGAGRAAETLRGGAGRANQRIHFRVRAPFCEEAYKWALGPAARPVACVLLSAVVLFPLAFRRAFQKRFHAGANCQPRGAASSRASRGNRLSRARGRPQGVSFFGAQSRGPADSPEP